MSDEPRQLDWTRHAGAFANASEVPKGAHATIRIAPDICPCCDERYVVIAAIHPSGIEVSVSLDPKTALEVANRILDSYATVALAPAAGGVRQ